MTLNEFAQLAKDKITDNSPIPCKMVLGFAEKLIERGFGSEEVYGEWIEDFLSELGD